MNKADSKEFMALLEILEDFYRPFTAETKLVLFRLFQPYRVEQIGYAIHKWITDQDRCQFAPKPGDLIAIIKVKQREIDVHQKHLQRDQVKQLEHQGDRRHTLTRMADFSRKLKNTLQAGKLKKDHSWSWDDLADIGIVKPKGTES